MPRGQYPRAKKQKKIKKKAHSPLYKAPEVFHITPSVIDDAAKFRVLALALQNAGIEIK